MRRRITLAVLLVTTVTTPNAVLAATPEQCAVLQRADPTIECGPDTVISDQERALGVDDEVARAKEHLLQNAKDLRGSKAPPTCPANIYRLNNTFSVCLSRFIKAADATYGPGAVTVVSAYRSPDPNDACGSNAAAGGAPGSNHQYGRAADVAPGRGLSFEDLQDFAKANPQFGVCFPYVPRLTSGGFYDPPHMALAGIDTGEARYCAQQGVVNYCDQSPAYDPNEIYNPATEQDEPLYAEEDTTPSESDPYRYPQRQPYRSSASFSPTTSYPYSSYGAPSGTTYDPAAYGGLYGGTPFYNPFDTVAPGESAYERLVEGNPGDYITGIANTGRPSAGERERQDSLSPPPYTPGGDPYTPEIEYIVSQERSSESDGTAEREPELGFIELEFGDTPADNQSGEYYAGEADPAALYDNFDPNYRPAEWVEGSFYERQERKTPWWRKLINFFGF